MKTMLKLAGKEEQLHSGFSGIQPRKIGQQVGVIVFGNGNQESAIAEANSRGLIAVVNNDHATLHR